jgi:hypothetical protein
MFSHQRKARILFGLSDVILTALAFGIAYKTRGALHWHFLFYLTREQKALVLGSSLLDWTAIGLWLEVNEKLDVVNPRIVLRDTVRQCAYGALCLLVFQYALRMDLSRFFLLSYACLAGAFLLAFRLTAGRVIGVIRREFAALHYVMVVGTGGRAVRIAKALEQSAAYGVRVRGFFHEGEGGPGEIVLGSAYKVYRLAELSAIVRLHVVA